MREYQDLPTTLDVPGAAQQLHCGERIVRDLIRNGDLGHVRLGRLIRIPRHALIAFLNGDASRGDVGSVADTARGGEQEGHVDR